MIRRIIWLLIIIGVTYGIYNWIDPEGAQALVHRIQSLVGKEVLTEDTTPALSGNNTTWIDQLVDITPSVYTGELDTWSLIELNYILSGGSQWTVSSWEIQTPNTWNQDTWNQEPAKTPVKIPIKKQPSSNTNELSQQDIDDIDAFFGALIQ